MRRRRILQTAGIATATLLSPASALAQPNGKGNSNGNGNGNGLHHDAALVDLDESDVVAQTTDPSRPNFEEEFTYWRIDHGFDYDAALYHEPARTGPDAIELGGGGDSFWFGVSAPDDDGIQHRIKHTGKVTLQLRDVDTGVWKELRLQFTGDGDLVRVNGVTV